MSAKTAFVAFLREAGLVVKTNWTAERLILELEQNLWVLEGRDLVSLLESFRGLRRFEDLRLVFEVKAMRDELRRIAAAEQTGGALGALYERWQEWFDAQSERWAMMYRTLMVQDPLPDDDESELLLSYGTADDPTWRPDGDIDDDMDGDIDEDVSEAEREACQRTYDAWKNREWDALQREADADRFNAILAALERA